MKLNSILLAGAALFIASGAQAQSAPVKVTYTGTVSGGYDTTGEFGAANTDLTGKSFVATYTFDPSLGYAYRSSNTNYNVGGTAYGGIYGASPLTAASLTIGNTTVNFTFSYFSEIYNSNDQFFSEQYSYGANYVSDENGYHSTSLQNYAYSFGPSSLPADYSAYNGPVVGNPYGGFSDYHYNYVTGVTQQAYANFTSTTLSIGAVPEPATWAMMILGMGMIGAGLRYRRKTTKASFA